MAQVRLGLPFYLGLGAPAVRRTYPDCRVRAAAGRDRELVRVLLALHRGQAERGAGTVETINFRCAVITLADSGEKIFFKQFPTHHLFHDIERVLRCSRVDRAWRAAHLLPRLGILTPRPVGTAFAHLEDGRPMEYLATEWIAGALPYHMCLRGVGSDRAARLALLREFAGHLRVWHDRGLYLRDLVTNVLTRHSPGGLEYWLTDLDQLHPVRRMTRPRLLHQMGQLARWAGPLADEEADAIVVSYLGAAGGRAANIIRDVLLTTEPAPMA